MESKSQITACTLCLLVLLALCLPAHADYHYASHEGSNEYPYTSWETGAWLIQDAVDATSPHDTVYVDSGEWYETVATEDFDSVAIIGMGMDNTFWYANDYHVPVLTIDYRCSVEGITFRHLSDWICVRSRAYADVLVTLCKFLNAYVALQSSGNSSIVNCIFDSCGTALSMSLWSGDYLISNNLMLNCHGDWAIMLQVESAVIQNNIFINQPDEHVYCISGSSTPVTIQNNIFINGYAGVGPGDIKMNNTIIMSDYNSWGLGGGSGDSCLIINNSISGCQQAIRAALNDVYVYYNHFWQNEVNIYGTPVDSFGNIFWDPMFVSNDDAHLQAYSPLIDSGDPSILDIDGTRSDIGAYGGPLGETYNYEDLPPAIPDSITGEFHLDTILINWRYNTEADFSNYNLYRDTISGFEPSVFNLLAVPDTSYYIDTDITYEHDYFYRIASVDNQDNVSVYSEELEVATTGIWDQRGAILPQITSIRTNYPNPFNSSTTIVFNIANLGPIPAEVEINIYDIIGRKIRTLIKERRCIGEHRVIWDGKDDNGNECSTGVYFARISQWGLQISGKPRKLILIK